MHHALRGDWEDVLHREDARGRRRVVRMIYEVATFQALREALRCKEIWVIGADRWRNPDDDLPVDYEQHRVEHYRSLRKPLDPAVFVDQIAPSLRDLATVDLVRATGLSDHYCSLIRLGKRVPHPRHWEALRLACRSDTMRSW